MAVRVTCSMSMRRCSSFLNQIFESFADLDLALLRALPEQIGQHLFDVMSISSTPWLEMISKAGKDFSRTSISTIFFVELAFAELVAKFFAGAGLGIFGELCGLEDASGVGTRGERGQQ